jgi:hypothetical protein
LKTVRLALSFDHELSLGGTDDYAKNLFVPTDRLLALARELSVPITLFTDVACAMRFESWDADRFFVPYRDQLTRAIAAGHDVQLHIHPHWFDSYYIDGAFRPSTTFGLGEFATRPWPDNIEGIIKRAATFLAELTSSADRTFRCLAYRAGGFNLAPETARIVQALLDNGIVIDSSIAKGFFFESNISSVDFRSMPSNANWFIAPEGPLNIAADAGLFEVPIASRPRTLLNNVPHLFKRVACRRRAPRPTGWSLHEGNTSKAKRLARLVPRSAWMLGFDNHTQSTDHQIRTLDYHLTHHREEEMICAAISHPKNMGEYAFAMMRNFVLRVRARYGRSVSFCTYREIADALHL